MNRRYKQQKPLKICIICGDKATGVNFGALTCMSCKIFQCPFEDSCQINRITRKFCAKCRIAKCFDVGMKKEWILSEEEKQEMKDRIARNRELKQQKMLQQLEILQASGDTSQCHSCRSPTSPRSPTSSSSLASPLPTVVRQSVIVTASSPTTPRTSSPMVVQSRESESSQSCTATRPETEEPTETAVPDFSKHHPLTLKNVLLSEACDTIYATKSYLQFLPKQRVDAS